MFPAAKHYRKYSFSIILFLLTTLTSVNTHCNAEQSHFENNKIKLIKDISLPDKIHKCIISNKLDKIVSTRGVYNLNDKHEPELFMKSDNTSLGGIEDISPDGVLAVEKVSDKILITNMNTGKRVHTEFSGVPMFCSNSILATSGESETSYFFDFQGNLLNQHIHSLSLYKAKAHKNGFIGMGGSGTLLFFDQKGMLLSDSQAAPENFDVSFENGTTAIITDTTPPSNNNKWTLKVYNPDGKPIFQHALPFGGKRCGIGLSPEGNYVAVSSMENGLINLFDIQQKQEIWTKQYDVAWHFTFWPSPIAVASNAQYIVFHGKLESVDSPYPLFIVIDRQGEAVGYIDPETNQIDGDDHRFKFIPNTNILVYQANGSVKIYEIIGSRGSR